MSGLITARSAAVPAALTKLVTLGRTPMQRPDDMLAYFERPGTGNGPTRR